jgi:hypothetical protein
MGTHSNWRTTFVLFLGLIVPGTVLAGPECGWWNHSPECPRSEYPRLHYWAPSWYLLRSQVHPTNLDQYPPGPACVQPSFEFTKYKCRTTPPTPSAPYADPASYYGRALTPP